MCEKKEIDIGSLLRDERSPLLAIFVVCFAILIVMQLELWRENRRFIGISVIAISTLIAVVMEIGRQKTIKGKLQLCKSDFIYIVGPSSNRSIVVNSDNVDSIRVERHDRRAGSGVYFYYHVKILNHDLFVSNSEKKANVVLDQIKRYVVAHASHVM